MGKALKAIKHLGRFLFNQEFREGLVWVRYIAKKLSFIHQNLWTSFRFPAGIFVIIASFYDQWLTLGLFIFSAFTDTFDGMVARYKKEQSGRFGALLDATADKCFATPIIIYWGYLLSPTLVFYLELAIMILIEASNLLLPTFEKKGMVESEMLYEHLLSGKFKFVFQVLLIGMLWFADFIFPNRPIIWIPLLHLLMGMIILLAFKSVFGKINRIRTITSK